MNKVVSGTIGLLALAATVPAMAADLSRPMSYKAPPMPVAYNWNGFYIGAHLGGGWASRDFSQTNLLFPGIVESGTLGSSGIVGGGQIGYNWQFAPTWLVGIEADISGADLSGSTTTTTPAGLSTVGWTDKIDDFGTVRARLGYVANNWLFYGTGGFAWANDTITRTQLTSGVNAPAAGLVTTNSQTSTGWVAGLGTEWGFAPTWTARLEYLHIDVGGGAFGFSTPVGVGGAINTFTVNQNDLTIDTVRVGVNHLFN